MHRFMMLQTNIVTNNEKMIKSIIVYLIFFNTVFRKNSVSAQGLFQVQNEEYNGF